MYEVCISPILDKSSALNTVRHSLREVGESTWNLEEDIEDELPLLERFNSCSFSSILPYCVCGGKEREGSEGERGGVGERRRGGGRDRGREMERVGGGSGGRGGGRERGREREEGGSGGRGEGGSGRRERGKE